MRVYVRQRGIEPLSIELLFSIPSRLLASVSLQFSWRGSGSAPAHRRRQSSLIHIPHLWPSTAPKSSTADRLRNSSKADRQQLLHISPSSFLSDLVRNALPHYCLDNLSELQSFDIRVSPSLVMVGLSLGEQNFIKGGIAQDLRTDGRKRLTYRPISVETGVIPQASGSARVKLGATDVIASVKAELGKPNPSHPDKGKVYIYVDCSPTAEPTFEGRGGEELSLELSSALQRCLLGGKSGEGAGIDLSSLSIVKGKVCWDLYIDGLVVSSDGNLLDALGAAIKAALSNTAIPKVQVAANASSDEQPEVDVSDEEFLQFDTTGVPTRTDMRTNKKKRGAGLDPSVILDMISVAKHVSEQLINKLDSEIAAAEARDEEDEMDS
ncbi:hypothetical protein DH2020_007659 [Rehmannia glutinosa]|uniref:Ribosomal RNA-processing protein 42 n=1 Tax=Rehmannia glutinosa TaxID=99300 RepID=A0ABR0TZS8_REHGL